MVQADPLYVYYITDLTIWCQAKQIEPVSGVAAPLPSPHIHTPDTAPTSDVSEEAGEYCYVKTCA